MTGNLELVNNMYIKGWCCSTKKDVPTIDLYVNNTFIRKVDCNIKRNDVVKSTKIENRFNAFIITDIELSKGDIVNCKFEDSNEDLKNSPKLVNTLKIEGNEANISELKKIYPKDVKIIKTPISSSMSSNSDVPFEVYEINDAYVNHEGIIFKDNYAIKETLSLFNSKNLSSSRTNTGKISAYYNKIEIKEHVKLISSFGISNYYHFIFDFIFRVFALETVNSESNYLQNKTSLQFQKELMKIFNLKSGDEMIDGCLYHIKSLYYIKPLRNKFNYNADLLELFLKKTRSLSDNLNEKTNHKKIYLSRIGNPNRKLENENELIKFLSDRGFVIIQPEKLTIKEQVVLFSKSELIIAPSGAALTNLIYNKIPDKTKVIEICPESIKNDGSGMNEFWASFFKHLKIDHKKIYSTVSNNLSDNIHKKRYTLDLKQLDKLLSSENL